MRSVTFVEGTPLDEDQRLSVIVPAVEPVLVEFAFRTRTRTDFRYRPEPSETNACASIVDPFADRQPPSVVMS